MRRILQSSGIILLAAISALAIKPNETPTPGWNLFSKNQDIQLGREAASQIERQKPLVRDERLQVFVGNIGRRLAGTRYAGGYPYTFQVVNDQSVNAFALPGGPTFVNIGLLRAAENEDQVAAVMAHEIAHVALRHGTHQASKANIIQLPAMIAGGIMGNGSMLGSLAQLGIGLGANSVLLKFSRDAESEADNLGARIMAEAGYNPIEMARFFEKLESQGGSRGPQFLSDHPNPGNRFRAIQEEVQYLPRRDYNSSSGNFAQIQSMLNGRNFQSSPRGNSGNYPANGYPDSRNGDYGSVQPSGRLRQYRSQAFDISYPDNWEAFGDPNGGAVTLAPRSGLMQGPNGATQIAYGVMISYYTPRSDRIDLRNDTMDLIRELQRSNPGLQVGRQATQRVNVDNEQALVSVLYSESPYQGETEHDTLLTVARPEGLWYALFIAPASAGHQFTQTFDGMLRSISFH